MSDDDSAEKSHEPSQRKLDKAREKGEIPRSADILTTAMYGGVLLFVVAAGAASVSRFADALLPMIEQPDRLRALFFEPGATVAVGGLVSGALLPMLPLGLIPMGLVILTLLATRGVVFAPTKLQPKLSRISPIQGFKNKFGRKGLFEFLKSFVKLAVYGLVLALLLLRQLSELVGAARATPAEGMAMLMDKAVLFLVSVLVVAAAIGLLDHFFQHAEHMRQNRMSHKEMRDEHKDSEGDPFIKQQRRAKAEAIAMNQMMGDVPKSDVVVVNPTHYAVALKWNRAPGSAPVCVAKGIDAVALRIREAAMEAGVPIRSDPPTARALHATVGIGQEVAPEHYEPVAAAIRFAEDMRRRAKERGWG